MFNQSAEAENLLALACDRYENLARAFRELQGEAKKPEALNDALTQARDLEQRLRQTAEELARLCRRFGDWDTLLAGLSLRIDDPETRFLASHAARAYTTAVAAFEALKGPPRGELIERYLDSLAHLRDRPGYRRSLARHAELLGVGTLDFSRLQEFGRSLAPALAELRVTLAEGRQVCGCAFLVSPRLLATCRALLVQNRERQEMVPCSALLLRLGGCERVVAEVVLPGAAGQEAGVALLRLAKQVETPALRVGHAQLLELGERVLAAGAAEGSEVLVERGIVNRFRILAGTETRAIEAGMPARAGLLGGPLLNDWGEVVGIVSRAVSPAPSQEGEEGSAERFVEALAIELLHESLPRPWEKIG
jgi:molecular chaperone DnaK